MTCSKSIIYTIFYKLKMTFVQDYVFTTELLHRGTTAPWLAAGRVYSLSIKSTVENIRSGLIDFHDFIDRLYTAGQQTGAIFVVRQGLSILYKSMVTPVFLCCNNRTVYNLPTLRYPDTSLKCDLPAQSHFNLTELL